MDPNACRSPGIAFTALERACRRGHRDVVRFLLAEGCHVGVGEPVLWAAYCGHVDLMELLVLEHGAPVNGNGNMPSGATPLMLVAGDGQLAAVQWLVRRGADVGRRDVRGWNAHDHVLHSSPKLHLPSHAQVHQWLRKRMKREPKPRPDP